MNTRLISKFTNISLSFLLASALYSCSGGAGDNASKTAGRGGTNSGKLTISLTDSVVDNASEVWVQFVGLSIQPADGETIDFTFDTEQNINLLDLEGIRFTDLLSNTDIPAGMYSWIRLVVNAVNDNINDTYIVFDDGSTYELSIPSGEQTGLKINTPFEITANQQLNLMLDFDLRKSIVLQNGSYKLRPTLRMVDKDNTENISGTIDLAILTADNCSDTYPDTGNAVYLYTGTDVIPTDIRKGGSGPVTSARIKLNPQTGNYEYIIAYVPAGDYTLAFTCQADLDDPNRKDDITFSFTNNVTVMVDSTAAEQPASPPDVVR